MNEFSRWIRYMLPGSVVSLQLIIAMLIMYPKNVNELILSLTPVNMEVPSLAGLLLGTGALGFIFSTVYHVIRNMGWLWLFNDHKAILLDLRKDYGVAYEFVGAASNRMNSLCEQQQIEKLKIRQRWELFNLIWHTEKHKSAAMPDVEPVAKRMHDIAHGLGATMFGFIISLTAYLYLGYKIKGHYDSPGLFILFWAVPIICFWIAYCKVNKSVGKLYDDSLRLYFADEIVFCHNRRYFYSPK